MTKLINRMKIFGGIFHFKMQVPFYFVQIIKKAFKQHKMWLFSLPMFKILNRPIHALKHEVAIGQELAIKKQILLIE
ncbi:hypothetical protein BTO15_10465 [Polaribacter sejongensis]|uniref:Uncharacterized protein n=1 Tax=Polaribacter sejongensis TaxID=985043 RepID=A0ABN5FEG4_9FLAO|nr:hypothetical protein BTO15_10465 [Polaribacter sejongensis]